MKSFVKNSNPFILLLLPVFFALIMGVTYQFHQKKNVFINSTEQATSLFTKSITLVKTVCTVAKEKLW